MATQLAGVPYGPLPTAAKTAAALAQPPRLIVIHDTSNSASKEAEAKYASTRPLQGATSAHFYVDTGGPLGSVPLSKQAWAAYGYANRNGWHIEMCGYNAGMKGAVPQATIDLTAHLVRQLCDLAGIPMVKLTPDEVAAGKRGICGHWDITTGLGVGDHDDPGRLFDWPAFIAAVKGDDMPLTNEDVIKLWTWDLVNGPAVEQAYAMLARSADKATAAAADAKAALTATVQLEAKVDALAIPAPAPVDPAALKAVMLDPAVVAVYAKALASAVGEQEAAADRARADALES